LATKKVVRYNLATFL